MKNNFYFKGNISNIYKEPHTSSEVTSQIIYGEKFKIFSKNKNWIKIKSTYDNYVGYIKNKQHIENFNPKYKVNTLKAKIYKKPNSATNNHLPLASKLSIEKENIEVNDYDKKEILAIIDEVGVKKAYQLVKSKYRISRNDFYKLSINLKNV